MKALFLNFASNNSNPDAEACFALVSEGKTEVYTPVDHRMGDSGVIPLLEQSLSKAGWAYKDLTHIAAIIGPGGFTSLRMAVSLANTLADQLDLSVTGIHLSDLYQARVTSPESREVMWFHSTKKDALFVRTFGIDDSPWKEPTLISPQEILIPKSHPSIPHWCGELIPDHRAIVDALGLLPAPLQSISDTLPSFLAAQKYEKALLQPWYGRGW